MFPRSPMKFFAIALPIRSSGRLCISPEWQVRSSVTLKVGSSHELDGETGLSIFPHSKQDGLAREVINPQNGHILCDRNSRAGGLSGANSVPNNAVIKVRQP